jgi:hypothetical protein
MKCNKENDSKRGIRPTDLVRSCWAVGEINWGERLEIGEREREREIKKLLSRGIGQRDLSLLLIEKSAYAGLRLDAY